MKFCYNNSNLARQVPCNDRLWWFIATLLTVFLLFNKNMALTQEQKNKILSDWKANPYIGNVGNSRTPEAERELLYSPTYSPSTDPYYSAIKSAINKSSTPVTPPTQPQTTSFDSIYASMYPGWDRTAAEQDWIAKGRPTSSSSGGGQSLSDYMRGQIESGYDTYINDLNNLYGGLNTQAEAQRGIAQNSYEQSIRDLLANKQSSLGDIGLTEQKLQANQVKNLRDIASNIQNQYMAGNVMLGARGAGDSSAANQYSYALNRLGSRERGNVMNTTAMGQAEIENQKAKLNNIVTQETSRLDTELANTKQSISSWLAEQQNAVSQMISQGKLNKNKEIASLTQNLLNQALAAYQTKQQEVADKRARLETWAMNNAKKISELAPIMQGIGQLAPDMYQARTLNGNVSMDAQGNMIGLYGFGNYDEDKYNYNR